MGDFSANGEPEKHGTEYPRELLPEAQHLKDTTDTNTLTKTPSFVQRLRKDPKYRLKVFDTACLWWAFFVFGWGFTLVGPTLPDLRVLVSVDLETAAWLFSSCYLGYMAGSILFGVLSSRVHMVLLLTISVFGLSVTSTLTPWCPWFGLMLFVRVFNGFFFGGIDTCCHSRLFALWKDEAHVWVQIMYFHFSTGGLIAPLTTEPFLIPTGENDLLPLNASIATYSNITESLVDCNATICIGNHTVAATQASVDDVKVHFAFLISGALSFLASVPLFVTYIAVHRFETKETEAEPETVQRKSPPRVLFYLVLGMMAFVFLIGTGWIETFSSMMMTFSLGRINWSKQQGALINSMMWIAYAIGNFTCIFLVQCFSTAVLLTCFLIGSVVGLTGMCIASQVLSYPLIWVSVLVTGFSMSILWPACFSWTEENVTPVSGRVASLFLVSGSIGLMVNPLLVTFLMEEVSFMWYSYFHLIEGAAMLTLFVTCVLLYRRVPEPNTKSATAQDQIDMEDKTKLLDTHGGSPPLND